ncbi:MAG: RluA family pseudouridine synthase [Alkaliphilus sp.]|nr:RluA family pseudouridine synthase [Alkaliphilus sp.]
MSKERFHVGELDEDTRLDIYLASQLLDMSRNYVQKLIEQGNVLVNGVVHGVKKYKVKDDDIIEVYIPAPSVLNIQAENLPIDIIYDDDDVLVVNKPQGMVVHPATGNYTGTLVNALLYHCKTLSSINGIVRPGIVHRIDKDTSGLLMIAKNDIAHRSLAAQLKEHSINRIYLALVHGNIQEEKGTIHAPIGRHPMDRLKMAVVDNNGKDAITHFSVNKRFGNYTLVEVKLETGRTHQIRVHMNYIRHSLVGDLVYGPQKEKFKLKGQALHAYTIGFIHPVKKEYMEFKADLPDYFQKLLKMIEEQR